MTFTYDSTDISTSLAKVRLLLQDTDFGNALFTDEEINAVLSQNGDAIYLAAADLARAIAASKALLTRRKRLGDLDVDLGDMAKDLQAQAAAWDVKHRAAAGVGARHVTRVDGYSDDVSSDEV